MQMQICHTHVAFNLASEQLLMDDSQPMQDRRHNNIEKGQVVYVGMYREEKQVCQFQ